MEIAVTSSEGRITAYASVIDNMTNDPMLVTPVTLNGSVASKWVMPGVANIHGIGLWRTDMRVFNAGDDAVEATMAFHSQHGGGPRVATITIPAGHVRQLDDVLPTLFGVTADAGAVHITTAAPARLVSTARTYVETAQGTFGQFISAVTPAGSAGIESAPLQLLQVEESSRFRSNLGLAEVTGNAVTLEVTLIPSDAQPAVTIEVHLGPNEFRQFASILGALREEAVFNARISVRVVSGTGRVTAYASVIDQGTNDPTYMPAQ